MNLPACHPTEEETRQLRALLIDAVLIARDQGYFRAAFHRYLVEAQRMPLPNNDKKLLIALIVTQKNGYVMAREIEIICDAEQ